MKLLLGLSLLVLVVGVYGQQAAQAPQTAAGSQLSQDQHPLTPEERKKVANLQKFFQQCRANKDRLSANQKTQCSRAQATLKQFQNLIVERTGLAPTAEDSATLEAELNVRLDPNLTLLKVTPELLETFLADKRAVSMLVDCFETFKKCRHKAGTSLVNDVLKLSSGLRCTQCSKEEQAKLRAVVMKSVNELNARHPKQWKRLLPYVAFLL